MRITKAAVISLLLCLAVVAIPSSAIKIDTVAMVENSQPTVNSVDTKVDIGKKNTLLEISVMVSDVNGIDDIDHLKLYLTNERNLGSRFEDTIWLNEAVLIPKRTEDKIKALYKGKIPYPLQPGNYYIEVQAFDKSGMMGSWLNYKKPQIAFRRSNHVPYNISERLTKWLESTITRYAR